MLINLSISIFLYNDQKVKRKRKGSFVAKIKKKCETSEKGFINIVAKIIYGLHFHLLCRLWRGAINNHRMAAIGVVQTELSKK